MPRDERIKVRNLPNAPIGPIMGETESGKKIRASVPEPPTPPVERHDAIDILDRLLEEPSGSKESVDHELTMSVVDGLSLITRTLVTLETRLVRIGTQGAKSFATRLGHSRREIGAVAEILHRTAPPPPPPEDDPPSETVSTPERAT